MSSLELEDKSLVLGDQKRRPHPILETLRRGAKDNSVFSTKQFTNAASYVAEDFLRYCGEDSEIRKEILTLAKRLGESSAAANSKFVIFPQTAAASIASALQTSLHCPDEVVDPQTIRRLTHARVRYLLALAQEFSVDPLANADEEFIGQVAEVLKEENRFETSRQHLLKQPRQNLLSP